MHALRQFFRHHSALAALLLAAALCLKVFLPAGYMPATAGSEQIVALCSSASDGATVTIRIPGKHGQDETSKSMQHSCAFAPLAAAAMGSVPPAIVLAALLFFFVAAIRWQPLVLRQLGARIHPPSQGPPLFA